MFQGRFKSVIVSPEEWGLELSRYLHLNPVRVAKLGLGKTEQVKGDEQDQRSAQRLTVVRPELERVIRCVEQVRGEKWEEFRDRHGDRGRDLVLSLGRRVCGMKLRELARRVGAKEDASVAMAIRRYAAHLRQNALERERVKQASELLQAKM